MKLLFTVVAAFLVAGAEAKGSAGYRSWKGGTYSRTRVYGMGGIFLWSRGYRGGRAGASDGASTSLDQLGISEDDVFCRRDVRLDIPSYTAVNQVTLNSTRYCYKEVTTTHGSPLNPVITSTWMDVYQWTLKAGDGETPTIAMVQYDDKDLDTPNNNSLFTVVVNKIKERDTTNEVDLSTLTWKATRVAPASKPIWGYPASYFRDEAAMTSFSINGVSATGDVDVILTFTVASDFAEDAYDDYTFIRPSGIRVDLTVRKWGFSSEHNDIGVDFVIASAKSTHSVGRPVSTKFGTEYDPRAMNRVEVGMPVDTETRGRHFFSWKGSTHTRQLCSGAMQPFCAELETSAACPSGLCQICHQEPERSGPLCTGLDMPTVGRASQLTIWARNSGDRDLYDFNHSNYVDTNYMAWSFVVGTWDYAEQVIKDSSAVTAPSLLLLVGSVLVLLSS